MTLVGAIPAGGALYALIMNILDRANSIGTVLLAVTITATVCTALIVLTPFIVLVFYKDTRLPMTPQPEGAAAGAAAAAPQKADQEEGFGDAIPEDFDEAELAASTDAEFDDDVDAYEDDEFGDYDEEYEEFDDDENL
tara:strand:+ start:66393 stop:66806 length:414 start_codon:yes stop_codon:yes gene_type:complete